MNIGFDFDKVFIDYPFFMPDNLIDRLYKKKTNGALLYRIPSRPEQFVRRLSHHPLLRPRIQQNIAFIKEISQEKNKLYLISSRFGFLKDITEQIIKKEGFDKIFDGIYFNYNNQQPHHFKSAIIDRLHIDIYVDDDFHLIKYLAKKNKKTQFFWLKGSGPKHLLTRNITEISRLSDILPNTTYANH